jgi:hypothetical protein
MSLVYIFNNSSSDELYLRELSSNGTAIKINGNIETESQFVDNTDNILELSSEIIQSDVQANDLIDVLYYITGNFFKFVGVGYPHLNCYDVIKIVDKNRNEYNCIITEIDSEFSKSTGYASTYTVYVLPTNNWFSWGVEGKGWGEAPWFGI